MANFPTSIDDGNSLPNPVSTSLQNNPSHSGLHDSENAAIIAIETKLGTGASTPTNNTVLRGNGTGTTAFGQVNLSTDVTGQLSSGNLPSATVTGPNSSTSGDIATFNGTGGNVIQDSGKVLPTGTIVGTSDTQVLTNKDLTSGTNSFPTSLVTLTGSQTLTNKTIDTAGPNTLKINGNTLSATAGTATVTIPNTTDTLVNLTGTQTLQHKTLDNTTTFNSNIIPAAALATNAITLGTTTVTSSVGSITTVATQLISLTVTVPAGGRNVVLICGLPQIFSTVAGDRGDLNFKDSSTILQYYFLGLNGTYGWGGTVMAWQTAPSAGSHTYSVTLVRGIGTGTLSAYADNTSPAPITLTALAI